MDDTDVEKAEFKMALDTSIQYLVSRVSAMDTPYELALTNYALTLANHPAQTDTRKKLEKLAKEEDGMKYWKNAEEQPKSADWWYYHSHPSVDIEMTSYVLLSHTYRKDIEGALPIMKWLVSQRNELGGFSSTQDTVIGLQALAEWGELSDPEASACRLTSQPDRRVTDSPSMTAMPIHCSHGSSALRSVVCATRRRAVAPACYRSPTSTMSCRIYFRPHSTRAPRPGRTPTIPLTWKCARDT
ncbi:PREDICTED: C3 and PZP-like alpha-2-macroglobulin domain-containing protein 8 [Priapulus caudatus]|uniref:C3 and PZP-like alpha-2-macroglobulin domain-containing protein 8 n=1 Tax=Priapulus caudatus TaxID=37621 RepID=A0ABM1EXI5_PRICU|nr:PREDICTED: C3 and PZP-like alpha-2-macroglobulin domain-containing protein 8 [Priapulus caudatus]